MRKTEAKDVVFVVGVKQFREVQNQRWLDRLI